jgi:hypothetical protein
MYLSKEQLDKYQEDGFLLLPEYFSKGEIDVLRSELPAVFAEDSPRRVIEKEGTIVRSVYGSHSTNEVFGCLARHPRLVEPATQILQGEVYVYQFKINAKAAFGGDVWQWHQDYIFWRKEDGLPTPRVLSVVIFLDEVNEFNGPMLLIPGSHKEGVIDVPANEEIRSSEMRKADPYQDRPSWISNLTADLKYSLDKQTIERLVTKHSIVAPKGPIGSAIFFNGNLAHASTNNISPFDRAVVIITFNSVDNIPLSITSPRPEFLVGRDSTPVRALSDDILLRSRRQLN